MAKREKIPCLIFLFLKFYIGSPSISYIDNMIKWRCSAPTDTKPKALYTRLHITIIMLDTDNQAEEQREYKTKCKLGNYCNDIVGQCPDCISEQALEMENLNVIVVQEAI